MSGMLTIGQLATHAGTTVRAVRHYHRIGLLDEPERDASGYRTYDASAVVRLIRIRVLASAGVPLGRVQELLDADAADFAAEIEQVDARLAEQIDRLARTRERLADLTSGDRLALPDSAIRWLDRLREIGASEEYIALERDAWILVAAQVPDRFDDVIATKFASLDDPDVVALYRLLGDASQWGPDDPRIVEVADLVERSTRRFLDSGEPYDDTIDEATIALLDAVTASTVPGARLIEILHERGWRGWTRLRRVTRPTTP
ncbi:MAG: MerR family transcriptional regulator [Gordonia paraffinivorans]